ncbi:hypothetical protein [Desulfovibrio inopinatus]|uniref:hypothetical protein n=1 Tax=Desulfovibrio inopinatus TaxID=102109 RepID=UPI0003FAABA9|nr:hypothetical protein [Desulfovibrio inopinatus]
MILPPNVASFRPVFCVVSAFPGREYYIVQRGLLRKFNPLGVFQARLINAVRLNKVRHSLTPGFTATAINLKATHNDAGLHALLTTGQEAAIRQRKRTSRHEAVFYEMDTPDGQHATGSKADAASLVIAGDTGALALALNHMHRYEPQALRLLSSGDAAVDTADDSVWLGQRQGMFADMAVAIFASQPDAATVESLVTAPRNHPLRPWPDATWFADSGAVPPFPATRTGLGGTFADLSDDVMDLTLEKIDEKGIAGLMTFGLYPRFWGTDLYGDEIDCDDPTPGDDSDTAYWCASWTDYHNTVATATTAAMRNGDVTLLDELSFPGALRMLHTQIMQCSPSDDYFYCGQAPAGYGGYREDFNSSHAYFDNLYLYYWLTGDSTVVDTLTRGASSMRDYVCSKRPDAVCGPHDAPVDEWANLTGRVATQWNLTFRFVGLASDDSSYLDDFRANLGRAVTQQYVQAVSQNTDYGFWFDGFSQINDSGSLESDQLWMASLYDMRAMRLLMLDTNNEAGGDPALTPKSVRTAWARTIANYGSHVAGDGTPASNWPNTLLVSWQNGRIGGSLTSVSYNPDASEPYLYDTGKAVVSSILAEVAIAEKDSVMQQLAYETAAYGLLRCRDEISPLSKTMGEYLNALAAAVAALNSTTPSSDMPMPTSILSLLLEE